jgi:hypothetical protein
MAITGHSDFVPCARASIGRTGATAGHDRQKMSMRVLKEDKQTEDDPAIKARWNRGGKSAGAGA